MKEQTKRHAEEDTKCLDVLVRRFGIDEPEIIRRVNEYPVLMGKLEHANSYDEMSGYDEHGEGLAWYALTDEQKAYWIKEAQGG